MSNAYAEKEVKKILDNKENDGSTNTALAAAWIVADFKGLNLKIIDMKETSSLADYYVLGSSENTTTSRSMADSLQRHFKNNQIKVNSVEGIEDGEWILIDAGDIIIHIFLETVRDVFDLDNLWRNNPTVDIPQEFYFSHKEEETAGSSENYF